MKLITLAAGLAAGLALGAGASHLVMAEDAMPGMDHSKMDHSAMSPASMGYMMAMDRMMKETPPQTGNADIDFAAGMIPHHQAAIDMAKVVLEHGKDPEIRKLAEAIIAAQEGEIAWMRDWLKKNPPQ
jgi:uncharacterized protein (DUF305 family)